jgi:RNA polymerase sigma factor (sigma-70 family)
MPTRQLCEVVQHLRSIVLLRSTADLTDDQLLQEYCRQRKEAALAAIVRRHGPMVWGVCRRILCNCHDAEDAFQATFLVLIRKATSIAAPELLANWLYGVARQTALKARAMSAKRMAREKQLTDIPEPATNDKGLWNDLRPLLDREIGCLPEKYRAAIVLCDLEGQTRAQAARQLGVPDGTLGARLARGRVMLGRRLARHGLGACGGVLAAMLAQHAESAPCSIMFSAIHKACLYRTGQPAVAGAISVRVIALTEGVLKSMSMMKVKIAGAFLLAIVLAGVGAGALGQSAATQQHLGAKTSTGHLVAQKEDHLKNTLMALDKALWDAFAKGDPETARKLYGDDYVGYSQFGRFNKASSLDSIQHYRPAELQIRDVELLRINEQTAILTYIYSVKLLTPSGELDGIRKNNRTSRCWVQRDGGWVLVFVQDLVLPGGE